MYEDLNDAIRSIDVNVRWIFGYKGADDSLLLFCESVASLLDELDRIAIRFGYPTRINRVPYSADNQQSPARNGNHKRCIFVTACAVRDVKGCFDRIGYHRHDGRNDQNCVEMTLREFQDVKELVHNVGLKANDQNQPVCANDLFSESTAHANSAAFYC